MMRTLLNRLRGNRRGSAMLETALVFSFFMTTTLVIMDYSRLVYAQNLMPQLAREGARWASVRGTSSAAVTNTTAISNYVKGQAIAIPATDITVTSTFSGAPGSNVTVETAYTYTPVVNLIIKTPTLTVRGKSVMQIAQ